MGCRVYLAPFILFLMENPISEHCWPWSDATLCSVCLWPLYGLPGKNGWRYMYEVGRVTLSQIVSSFCKNLSHFLQGSWEIWKFSFWLFWQLHSQALLVIFFPKNCIIPQVHAPIYERYRELSLTRMKKHFQEDWIVLMYRIHHRNGFWWSGPQGYKTFFMLNSAQHEILNARKYNNIKK